MEKQKHNNVKQILERKLIPLTNAIYREDADTELKYLHQGKDGFITIATKPGLKEYGQWHLKYNELIPKVQNFMDVENVYISMNSFWTTKRRLGTVRHLNCFWVDLDYYNIKRLKNKTVEEIIELLREKGMFEKIVEPSFFVDSGNGMYLVWLINDCSKQMLGFWQVIQDKICLLFEEYGADKKSADCTHVLRLAGTTNGKTGRRARFIYNSNKKFRWEQDKEGVNVYTIQQLGDRLLDKLPYSREEWYKLKKKKAKTKKEKEKCKTISLLNLHSLNLKRMEDIEKLVELRKGNCEGLREKFCFLYRYYSCCFLKNNDLALQSTLELNKKFINPLTEKEVINSTRSAENAFNLWEKTFEEYMQLDKKINIVQYFRKAKCYIYSNKKLIVELQITQDEMKELGTIINTKEKNRRSKEYRNEWKKKMQKKKYRGEDGLTSRERAKIEKMQQIQELIKQNMKKSQIAKNLGISRRMVYKYIDEINNKTQEKNVYQEENKKYQFDMNELFERVDTPEVQAIII